MPPIDKIFIYHITHVRNLASILAQGGLISWNQIKRSGVTYSNIAHSSIQDRRSQVTVPLYPDGNLHDYVPFYFGPRSPMLYSIANGYVDGYNDGEEPVIYFVVSFNKIISYKLPYVFTDGHAIMGYTSFYADPAKLDQIDWDLMGKTYWYDTPEDPDRKRRRQAEALIHDRLPWEMVGGIAVKTEPVKSRVDQIISECAHKPIVKCMPQWYY